jgi:glycosyltransferase involved in cell wall biosynthesis
LSKVSVIIPSRNERFMPQTVNDLYDHASGEIEVFVVLDGYWATELPAERPSLHYIHFGQARGMRAGINAAASVARGKYLLKCDAHCSFSPGWDEILQADCDDNWIVIPRRHSLDAENWCIDKNGKPPRDYHYLCYPDPNKDHDGGMHGVEWPERGRQRAEYDIDDTMSFQGSCWFMSRKHWDWIGGMDEHGYGTFSQEPQEIGNKTWLGGGFIKVNKKCHYLHLHKGKQYGRMYHQDKSEVVAGHNYSAWFWMTDQPFNGRVHNIDWLVEKFWPVPTWPENWRESYANQPVYSLP